MKQDKALELLKSGRNIFLTGSAGTGKTYVLNKFIQHLKDAKIEVAITASTGIAATHIKGMTIHSWTGMGIKQTMGGKEIDTIKRNKRLKDQLNKAKVLIIDEISMLHQDQLNTIHDVLSYVRDDSRAFGGMQVVLCGDFFQLPPIDKFNRESKDKFAFMSSAWVFAGFNVCYLTEQYRQSNNELTGILDEIRAASITQKSIDLLKSVNNTTFKSGIEPTKLYTHNLDVDKINNLELKKLEGKSRFFKAKASGDKKVITTLEKQVLTPKEMQLKIGAKVMFIKNNPEKEFINGTLGEVIRYSKLGFPVVKTIDNIEITASTEEWTVDNEVGTIIASFKQIPLRLAWAITVHKSQGMTLDAAELDLSKTFEKGQGYVALSRLKDINRLRLLGFNQTALEVDNLALRADKRFQELSIELDENTSTKELNEEKKTYIKSVGGRNLTKVKKEA